MLRVSNSLPAAKKKHLKMLSTEVFYCMLMLTSKTNFDIQANSLDPDQTAPIGAVRSVSTLFTAETF